MIFERKLKHQQTVDRLRKLKNVGCYKCLLGYFDEETGLLCCVNGLHTKHLVDNKKCEQIEEG